MILILKRFLSYYKPHRLIFTLDMLAALLVALVGMFYPIITRQMLNDLIPNRKYQLIVISGAVLLALYVARMLLNYFIQYYGHIMGVRMQAQMRSDMFTNLERLPYSFFDRQETGKLMSRMTSDLNDISELAHHGPENIIISVITVIASFSYLCTIDVYLTLIIFVCVPFLLVISTALRKKMRNAFMASRVSVAEINASLESSISGIRVTKAFTNAAKEQEKFEVGNGRFVAARREAYHAMGLFHSGTTFVTDVFNVIVLIAGGFFLYNGRIGFGDYSAFIVSVSLFLTPVKSLIGFMEQYQNGVTGFERFCEIVDAEPERDAEDAVDAGVLAGEIELKNVTHSYGDEDGKNVLKNISFKIGQGKKFALVGPSGGGKTTICHLIPHFYEIAEGDIFIDGEKVNFPGKKMPQSTLRRMGFIFQQPNMLPWFTVRENVALPLSVFNLKGKEWEKRVDDLLEMVGLSDYANAYPNEISGGMLQRAGVIRAMVHDPEILLMDEPFGALDELTREQMNMELLDIWTKTGKTIIFITHNIEEAVLLADKVFVMGTHPGRLTEVVDLELERPRQLSMITQPKFIEYRRYLESSIGELDLSKIK